MKHWSKEIEVNGVTIKFMLDTGAYVTVIGDSIYSRSSAKPISREHTRSYTGLVKANFTAWVYSKRSCD